MATEAFSTKVFNDTLKELLSNCDSSTWPRSINKHGFFTVLAALKHTEKDAEKIKRELAREIGAKRKSDGVIVPIPVSFAIAAKRASKGWVGQKNIGRGFSQREKAKALRSLSLQAWRAKMDKKLNSMIKGRVRSSGFIKSGWVNILQGLGPKIGGKYDRSQNRAANVRGASKGHFTPAEKGRLQIVLQNTAAARSEHRGGFLRIGEPALQRGVDEETNQMIGRIRDEMMPDVERFNRKQH